jgi:putative Holliday junction resolvase
MRLLAIDYGARRWGLAGGDELGVALPLPALVQPDLSRRWSALEELVRRRGITAFVVGLPLNMDDSAGFKAREAEAFAAQLREKFQLPVHMVDERLTTYEAEAGIARSRRRKLRPSGQVDSRAAAIFLQEFLDQNKGSD